MHRLSVLLLALACLAGAVSGGGVHDGRPEYLAVYLLGVGGSHTLELGGAGDEASVEFMVVPSSSADREGLEEAEEVSTPVWEDFSSGSEAPASLPAGSSAVPSRSVVYTASLVAGGGGSSSASAATNQQIVAVVPLAISEAGAYALLLNHGEIPAAVVSPGGETLLPVASEDRFAAAHHEEGEEGEEEDGGTGAATASQWANALAASFLISLCSFVGIITIVSGRVARKINLSLAFLFASGALLTTAVVHIIPDAMDGLAPEYPDDPHGLFLRSGVAVMAGIFLGFLLHVVLDNGSHSHSSALRPLRPPLPAAAAAAATAAAPALPRGDAVATPPVSEETSSESSAKSESPAGSGSPAGTTAAAVAAVAAVVVETASSDLTDGNERGCGESDQAAGATPRSGNQRGTEAENCGEGSRGCGGDEMEEGRGRRRWRPSGGPSEAASGARKQFATAAATVAAAAASAARSRPLEPPGEETGAVPTAGSGLGPFASSSLYDARRGGADRGLFDVAGLDPVCWNVICGDLAHNFSDGVTMAAAFLGCSPAVGWTVTAANMMHEIPHEVGNFLALVNGGMSAKQALLYNFFSALFAVFGVVLTFSLRGLITTTAISYLLLLGAGMFVFVGLSELVPDALSSDSSAMRATTTTAAAAAAAAVRSSAAEDAATSNGDASANQKKNSNNGNANSLHRRTQARKALAFTVGAVLLGLPLLTHRHCEADGSHGHDHR